MKNKKLNVVYASDEKFAEILAVSLESLMQTNPNVTIYVLNNGMSQASVNKIRNQAKKYACDIQFMPLKELEEYAGRELSCQGKISKTAYFRLFMTEIVPNDVDNLLYLDCDTMVLNSLDELACFQLKGACGAVAEPTAKLMKKKISLKKDDIYFNSGVLLVNLKKWREENITQKFVDYMEKKNGKISFEDQGVINHVLRGQIDILPFKFNVTTQFFDFGFDGFSRMKKDIVIYGEDEVNKGMRNPSIVHFTNSFASERPWVIGSYHKYTDRWRKYKVQTDWKDSSEWESSKDFVRRTSKMIYNILPRKLGAEFIYFINGIVRAFLS